MSKYAVLYYTRTNNSQRVAEKIASALSCELIQVTDEINWKGPIGYIKAGFYSTVDKHVAIDIPNNLDAVEEIIVVGPIWAGKLASPLRTLVGELPRDKTHLVVTSIGSHVEDRAGYLSVHDITSNTGNEDAVIEDLVNQLLAA